MSVQVVAIVESWLTQGIHDNEILPNGYSIYRRDRNSRGGGILLCIHNSLPSKLIFSHCRAEFLAVEICSNPSITIGLTYRSPNATDEQVSDLFKAIEELANIEHLVILGDFNCPDINWQTLSGGSHCSSRLCDLLFDHNLTQLVESPTHAKGNILDLIITNSEDLFSNVWVEDSNKYSDHFVVNFTIASFKLRKATTSKYSLVFDYTKADFEGMCSFLQDFDFSDFLQSDDVEDLWQDLKSILWEAINLYVPQARIHNKKMPKWFTPDIRHCINKLRHQRRTNTKNPSTSLRTSISKAERALQEKINTARSMWERELVDNFADTSNNKIYLHIRSLSRLNSFPNIMRLDSREAFDPHDKAEIFNQYFHSVLTDPSEPSIEESLPVLHDTLSTITFEHENTYKALASIDPSKAMGIDEISPKVLKYCASALSEPVHHLFQSSINQGHLPREWKLHLVTPIFKSGDRSMVNNYRPISLLCIISKVLERLVFDHIIDFISDKVINQSQFGFLRGKSTIQQLLIFLEDITSYTSHNDQVDAVYLDFRKAFDSVPHAELLQKLRRCGITGKLWEWFKEYLSNRHQCTTIEQQRSGFLPVLSGVPQGSILGPILFILYLNDLPNCVLHSKILSFADDTKCYKVIQRVEDTNCLQEDLDCICSWSSTWKLKFNLLKFALLHFNSSQPELERCYTMCGAGISSCESHRDLGVILSSDMTWVKHYQSILSKAYGKLAMIRRTFSLSCPVATRKTLYISLIRSQLVYGSQLWRPMLIKDVLKIEQLQRRATKYILQDYSSDYKSRLLSLNILPLMMLYELHDIMFFVNNVKNPSESFDILNHVSFSTSKTRSGSIKLVHLRPPTNSRRHFYFHRLIRLWNALPAVDLSLSNNTIRRKVSDFLWYMFTLNFDSSNPCSFHFLCNCNRCTCTPKASNFNSL